MSRKVAILRQFLEDADRLQDEVESAFSLLKNELQLKNYDVTKVSQQTILSLYRPVHSFKSIASMVSEGKPLEKVYHEVENFLPPLLKNVRWNIGNPKEAFQRIEELLSWSGRYVSIIREKMSLCLRLGTDLEGDNGVLAVVENNVHPNHSNEKVEKTSNVWIHVSLIQGVLSQNDVELTKVSRHYGDRKMRMALIILEESGNTAALWVSDEVKVVDRVIAKTQNNAEDLAQFLEKQTNTQKISKKAA